MRPGVEYFLRCALALGLILLVDLAWYLPFFAANAFFFWVWVIVGGVTFGLLHLVPFPRA